MSLLRREGPYEDSQDSPPQRLATTASVGVILYQKQPRTTHPRLPCLDNGGLLQQVLLDAAYVLSGNRDGYLKKSIVDGDERVPVAQHLLEPGVYTYTAYIEDGNEDEEWTAVAHFAQWIFPTHEFPLAPDLHLAEGINQAPNRQGPSIRLNHWLTARKGQPVRDSVDSVMDFSSNMTDSVRRRDGYRCVLSAWQSVASLQNAHLVPQVYELWYHANLTQYNLERYKNGLNNAINDITNGILLRSDLHSSLDRAFWFVYPKERKYVAHFTGLSEDARHHYHNVELRLHSETGAAALFARFAHSIFQLAGRGRSASRVATRSTRSRASLAQSSIGGTSDIRNTSGSIHSMAASMKMTLDEPFDAGNGALEEGHDLETLHSQSGANDHEDHDLFDATLQTETVDEEIEKARTAYVRSHPTISAIKDPMRMADERTWRSYWTTMIMFDRRNLTRAKVDNNYLAGSI